MFNTEQPDGVCGSRWNPVNRQWSKSSDCFLNQLDWPLLYQRQICQLHNIIHHLSVIIFMQYFAADNGNSNPLALDTSISTINPYQFPFYQLSFSIEQGTSQYSTDQRPQTIRCCPQALLLLLLCVLYYFIVFVFACFPCILYLSFLRSTFAGPAFCVTLVF